MGEETYFIIYPRGDKTRLCVHSLTPTMMYEKNDYSVASRKEFLKEKKAIKYAKKLAEKHSLIYEGNEEGYLD